MIGTTLAHFRIAAKLGEGGMGEVYLAEDTELERQVALKVLPEDMASDPERLERFRREARTLAALNHPNIAAIYSIQSARAGTEVGHYGDDRNIEFLVMELVEGKTLDALTPSGGMDLDQFLSLGTPIADALATAHAKGIVHRDLKPANVMVTDEGQRVKVLDFGLAKLADSAVGHDFADMPTEALTQEGLIVGTPHYMSPEQAKGETVDQRSDIFALGVMMYEMATGTRPFQGASSVELFSSVLKDTPSTVSDVKPELPRHLSRVIGRCLEKSPVDRYQTARDVFNELRALTKEASGDPIVSVATTVRPSRDRAVAILPFRAPAADAELATLAEGLTDDVTTGLARFPYFSVLDGSTIGLSDSSSDNASGPGVAYLLRGGLRSAGSLLRVNVQLVDVQTGAHLWAESYDMNLEDSNLFEIQDELTDRIVATVADRSGVLLRSLAAKLRDIPEDELTVDDWALRAVAFQQNLSTREHATLRNGLEAITKQHPHHALAFAWLAMIYSAEYTHLFNPKENPLDRWLEAAQRAVDLDPTCQDGWDVLASAHYFRRDLVAFEAAATRALALNPRNTAITAYIGMQICYSGDWERGHELMLKARSFNPHHPGWYYFPTFYYHYREGRYEEALEITKKINMPELLWTPMVIAAACGQLGRLDEARKALEELQARGIDAEQLRPDIAKWFLDEALVDHVMEGLRKARGENVSDEQEATVKEAPPATAISGDLRFSAFVGRETERAQLDHMLEETVGNRGGLVLLGGEPGVGKTRLATEILQHGRERGMLALTGHAYEDEAAPFVMATEILEEMVRRVPATAVRRMLGQSASEVSRLLPELRSMYSDIPDPADVPPELLQRHLFKSVLEFLRRAGAEQPIVMLLDDIHWADESSLALLEHLAARLADLPILMIGTYRDVEADIGKPFARSMATLVRQRLAGRIQIKPFDETSVAQILERLGGCEPPQGLAQAIHEATEGNVFFIEETFRHLSEEGKLLDDTGAWRTKIDLEHLDVPEGVRLVTARRLERLTDATQKTLGLAAVVGLRFSISVLEAASQEGDTVLDAIEEAQAAQLLKPATEGRELRYEFVHALARQTLLGDLSPLRQQRMHLNVADAIEQSAGDQAEQRAADITHHLLAAGASADTDRTIQWLTAAGTNAVASAAMEEAVHYFDTALELAGEKPSEVHAALLHKRGSARLSLGQRDDYVEDLTRAFDEFGSLDLGSLAATVIGELSYGLIWNAQPDAAKTLIRQALDLIGDESSVPRCRLLSAQGLAHGMASEPVEAEELHREAVEMARKLGEPAVLAETLQNQAIDGWFRLNGVLLQESGHEAAAIRRDLHHEFALAHCLWMEQAGLVWQGRYDEAEKINEELHPLAERNEDVGSLAISAMMNCLIEHARGNMEESSRQMLRSIELFESGGFPWGWISHGHYSVNALLVGDYDRARTAFDLAGENAIQGIVWSGADTCYQLSGKARLGDSDTLELFKKIADQIPASGTAKPSGPSLLLMGAIEALALIGENQRAAELYPAMHDIVSSGAAVQNFTYGFHERFAGIAAAAGENWVAAEAHFQKSMQLAEDLGHKVEQARAPYWYARMLLARGEPSDRKQARNLLAEARTLSETMGLRGLVDWIDDLL